MRPILSFYTILITITSCSDINKEHQKDRGKTNLVDSVALRSHKLDSIKDVKWVTTLKNLNEPNLKSYNKDAFRFVLKNPMSFNYYLFRIEKDKLNSVALISKIVNMKQPDNSGKDTVLEEIKEIMTINEWNKVLSKASGAYIWSLEKEDYETAGTLDCSDWTIEGSRIIPVYSSLGGKDYAFVHRYCPYGGSFYELGNTIKNLSKLYLNEKN